MRIFLIFQNLLFFITQIFLLKDTKTDIGNFNIDFIQCNNPASKISAFTRLKNSF